MKLRAPAALIANLSASAPESAYVYVVPGSESIRGDCRHAAAVLDDVDCRCLRAERSAAAAEVMTGASLPSVIASVTVWLVWLPAVSVAVTPKV